MSKSKGSKYERRFARFLDEAGYAVMKSPSSGSGTSRDQPDVFAVSQQDGVAAEVKYNSDREGIIYLDQDEIDALVNFASLAGVTPLVVARWGYDRAFYCFHPSSLERTSSGGGEKLRATREMVDDDVHASVLADSDGDWNQVGDGHGYTPYAVAEVGVIPGDD